MVKRVLANPRIRSTLWRILQVITTRLWLIFCILALVLAERFWKKRYTAPMWFRR